MNKYPVILNSLSTAVQDITHKIRTPLSTIINDLTYFQTQLPAGETTRPIEACKKITTLLETLSSFFPKLKSIKISVSELAESVKGEQQIYVDKQALMGAIKDLSVQAQFSNDPESVKVLLKQCDLGSGLKTSSALLVLASHGTLEVNDQDLVLRIPYCD